MTAHCRSAVVAGLVLTLTLAGCSGENAVSSPFPPRPVNVAIDNLSPCSMLDDSQRARLALRVGTPRTATVNGSPSAACTWIDDNGYGYNAQTIPIAADAALTEDGAMPIIVNGFGAARAAVRELTGGAPTCQVTVDAAPGRAIRVQARVVPRPPLPSDDEMCRLATEAASMVMTTVVRAAG